MSFKNRLLSLFHDPARILVFLFFPAYMIIWFGIAQKLEPEVMIHCSLDDVIPFCEVFVIPYVLWYLYFAVPMLFFMFYSRKDFLRTGMMLIFGITVSIFIFLIKPNAINFRPTSFSHDNIFVRVVLFIYSIDPPKSVFPSLHCYVAMAITTGILKSEKFKGKLILKTICIIFTILVCMSTVLIKQHSVLDFVGAVILLPFGYVFGFIIKWRFIYPKKEILKV